MELEVAFWLPLLASMHAVVLVYEDSWSTLFDSLEYFSDDFREGDRGCKVSPKDSASGRHRQQPESQERESAFE